MRKGLLLLAVAAGLFAAGQSGLFSVLKSNVRIGRQPGDFYLLTSTQLLKPWGEQQVLPGRPVDLVLDSRQHLLAVLNWRGISFRDASTGVELAQVRSASTSYTGVAFRPGDREIWASEATRNGPDGLLIVGLAANGTPGEPVHVNFPEHPVPSGLAFSGDGKIAYVALSRNNTLAVMDAGTRKLEREIPVGMAPFGVAVSAKQNRIFVTNRAGRRPAAGDHLAPSSGSNVVADPNTGATSTGTVSVIDAKSFETREVEVGLAPSSLALSPDEATLAVADGHSDTVSLIDTASLARTFVKIPAIPDGVLGSQPIVVAFAPDGKTLYTGCAGTNAIAVLRQRGKDWRVAGSIPTGWIPSGLAALRDGSLRVVNIKGVGNTADAKGTFNSRQYQGSILALPALSDARLSAATREVRAANSPRFEAAGGVSNLASLGIQHVFFIVKENRTYDQLFGDIAKGNGDPKLVFYGRDITPNHHALAEKYVLLDNFYTGGAISFDGHHWLMQGFVSDYVERAFSASPRGYAWNMADSLTVTPAGFFWQNRRRPLSTRIYGEFCLPARWDPVKQIAVDMNERELLSWSDYWKLYQEGKWQSAVGSRSGVPALQKLIDPRYPNNSTSIPDQIRAEEFLRELSEFEKRGDLPNLSIITLNNDHTNGTRPGSPTPKSMVADNDLALGRVVEGISKSKFWANSLILVVEDDAQDGVDHVDGHRTIALAIGPKIRRTAVDSNYYNHASMVRTIQEIFAIAPSTRHLKAARPMTSIFAPEPDLSTYTALKPAVPLDQMNPPLRALSGRPLWAAKQSAAMNWAEPDDIPEAVLNRVLWWDSKGYETPYPALK